jgi:hypothetical protein
MRAFFLATTMSKPNSMACMIFCERIQYGYRIDSGVLMGSNANATLQVFAGNAIRLGSGKQFHMLVAAASRDNAIEALQKHGATVSPAYFDGFWSTSKDAARIALASSEPGRVFAASGRDKSDYSPLPLQA